MLRSLVSMSLALLLATVGVLPVGAAVYSSVDDAEWSLSASGCCTDECNCCGDNSCDMPDNTDQHHACVCGHVSGLSACFTSGFAISISDSESRLDGEKSPFVPEALIRSLDHPPQVSIHA